MNAPRKPQAKDGTAKPAKKRAAKPAEKESKDSDNAIGLTRSDINKILKIAAVAIVAITVIFILIGVVQDKQRKKKLSAPPQIPDFIREMKEYERKHPEKRK